MILKSIIASLTVGLLGGLFFQFIANQPDHMIRGAVAFFIAGLISSIITQLIGNTASTSQSTAGNPSFQPSASKSNSSNSNDDDREEGEVKWFNVSKGFGFITREAGDDIFVHYRSIRGEGHRSLSEGQKVEYEVVDSDKGLQAEDVVALTPSTRRRR